MDFTNESNKHTLSIRNQVKQSSGKVTVGIEFHPPMEELWRELFGQLFWVFRSRGKLHSNWWRRLKGSAWKHYYYYYSSSSMTKTSWLQGGLFSTLKSRIILSSKSKFDLISSLFVIVIVKLHYLKGENTEKGFLNLFFVRTYLPLIILSWFKITFHCRFKIWAALVVISDLELNLVDEDPTRISDGVQQKLP